MAAPSSAFPLGLDPWQILDEAPEVYEAADRLIEAADWAVWQLTGVETRNSCTAGYKAIWSKREGFPPDIRGKPPGRPTARWPPEPERAESISTGFFACFFHLV